MVRGGGRPLGSRATQLLPRQHPTGASAGQAVPLQYYCCAGRSADPGAARCPRSRAVVEDFHSRAVVVGGRQVALGRPWMSAASMTSPGGAAPVVLEGRASSVRSGPSGPQRDPAERTATGLRMVSKAPTPYRGAAASSSTKGLPAGSRSSTRRLPFIVRPGRRAASRPIPAPRGESSNRTNGSKTLSLQEAEMPGPSSVTARYARESSR